MNTDRPEQEADDGVIVMDAEPACVALVPVTPTVLWSQAARRLSRPDSIFVTHLMASAEQVPQTRNLRRATLADAQNAYQAYRHPMQGTGIRTRQVI